MGDEAVLKQRGQPSPPVSCLQRGPQSSDKDSMAIESSRHGAVLLSRASLLGPSPCASWQTRRLSSAAPVPPLGTVAPCQ